jgi:hypothetical protein
MKIRIYCSKEKEKLLQINNEEINLDNYKKINEKPEDIIEYISRVDILYATKLYEYNKTINISSLIFTCNRDITEEEFKDFIELLKRIGFRSSMKKKHNILCVDDDYKEVIFNYNFKTNKPNNDDNKYQKKKNKSLYKQQNLYIRN